MRRISFRFFIFSIFVTILGSSFKSLYLKISNFSPFVDTVQKKHFTQKILLLGKYYLLRKIIFVAFIPIFCRIFWAVNINLFSHIFTLPVGNHAHLPTWPLSDPPTHTPVVWSPGKKSMHYFLVLLYFSQHLCSNSSSVGPFKPFASKFYISRKDILICYNNWPNDNFFSTIRLMLHLINLI